MGPLRFSVTHRRAILALILVTCVWGVSITAVKALLSHATPMLAVAVRFGLAGVLLIPLLRGTTPREARGGLVIGLLFAAGVVCQNLGLALIPASRNAFIVSLSAILTPAVGALALAHRVPLPLVLRILAALGGVYLLTAPAGSLAAIGRGDLLTLISAVLYAGQIVAVGHWTRGASAARLLCIQFLATGGAGVLLGPVLESPRMDLTPGVGLLVVGLVASSYLTFGLQFRAQRVVTASEAALIFTFEPVVTSLTSYLAFGERLSPQQWLGALVILAAVGWPERKPRAEPAPAAPPTPVP